eukprot:gene48800-65437_t
MSCGPVRPVPPMSGAGRWLCGLLTPFGHACCHCGRNDDKCIVILAVPMSRRLLPSSSISGSSYADLALRSVRDLIELRALKAHFQPIVDLRTGEIFGHEALIRGPANSPLAQPDALFAAADREGLSLRLEQECLRCALRDWAAQQAGGKLLLNLSAAALVHTLGDCNVEDLLAVEGSGVP